MTLYATIDHLSATNPRRLASLLHSLIVCNVAKRFHPEARRYVALTLEPITPESLEADTTLSAEQKARVWDDLFEWHSEEEDGPW